MSWTLPPPFSHALMAALNDTTWGSWHSMTQLKVGCRLWQRMADVTSFFVTSKKDGLRSPEPFNWLRLRASSKKNLLCPANPGQRATPQWMPGCACSQLWIATDLLQQMQRPLPLAFLFAGADDLSHRRNLAANFEDVAGLQYLILSYFILFIYLILFYLDFNILFPIL